MLFSLRKQVADRTIRRLTRLYPDHGELIISRHGQEMDLSTGEVTREEESSQVVGLLTPVEQEATDHPNRPIRRIGGYYTYSTLIFTFSTENVKGSLPDLNKDKIIVKILGQEWQVEAKDSLVDGDVFRLKLTRLEH